MTAATASFAAAAVLAAVQLGPRLLPEADSERLLPVRSLAGGFSVAFVFLHLLPTLEAAADDVARVIGPLQALTEYEAHLLALAGLVTLYGLERFAQQVGSEGRRADRALAVEIAVFAVYYGLVGLLTWDRAHDGGAALLTFVVAVGLHLLVIDWGLARRRHRAYQRVARPLLAAAVLAGWLVGLMLPLRDAAVAGLLAFLAGGVVLVAMKEELPAESQGRFGWFLLGALLYAGLLAAMAW